MAKNRQCICCGEKYNYCPDCSRADKLAPTWKSQFCSEDCMSLFMTLTRYNMSRLTKDEAKEIISSLNLKPIDAYASCVQRDYDKIMFEEKKPKRGKRIEITPIDEAIEQVVEPVVEQSVVEIEAIIEQPVEAEEVVETHTVHEVIFENNKEL